MQVGKRGTRNGSENGWIKVLVLVLIWLMILSLSQGVLQLRSGFGRITEAESLLEAEMTKNQALQERLELVQTEGFREKLIREKLNMQKEGEVWVVLPGSISNEPEPNSSTEIAQPVWAKWLSLLLRV